MTKTLYRCLNCNLYSLTPTCVHCGGKAIHPYPAKFSLEKQLKYRKYVAPTFHPQAEE